MTVTNVEILDEGVDGFVDLFKNPVGGTKIIGSDVFPYVLDVSGGVRVEDKSWHRNYDWLPRRASLLLLRRAANASSPSIGFTRPLASSS